MGVGVALETKAVKGKYEQAEFEFPGVCSGGFKLKN